jgi:hypothetical protein
MKLARALLIRTPPAAHRGTAAARAAPGTPSSGDDAANAGAPRPPTSGTESRHNAARISPAAPATMTTRRIRFVPPQIRLIVASRITGSTRKSRV